MEYKIPEPKKVKVTIEDRFYDVSIPTIGESRQLEAQLKEDDAKPIELMVGLLDKKGFPEKESNNMDQESFLALYTYLSSLKKT